MRGGDLNFRPFALAAGFFAAISSAAISEAANCGDPDQ